jgi:hypothetical protein
MDGDHGSGLSDGHLRRELERRRPDCEIEFDEMTKAWGATMRTSATRFHYIVGPSLPELAIKLGVEGSEAG